MLPELAVLNEMDERTYQALPTNLSGITGAELDWRPQSRSYVRVFDNLSGRPAVAAAHNETPPGQSSREDERGRIFVDLSDDAELRRFVVDRTVR